MTEYERTEKLAKFDCPAEGCGNCTLNDITITNGYNCGYLIEQAQKKLERMQKTNEKN